MAITSNDFGLSPIDSPVGVSDVPSVAATVDVPGIPQSSAPPSTVPAFGENPWVTQEQDAAIAENERISAARSKIYGVALDPDSYFSGKDLGVGRDPKKSQMMAINSAFMELESGDQPVPMGETDIQRRLMMQDISLRKLGVAAKDEATFHAAILKDATKQKDTGAVLDSIQEAAKTSAAVDLGEHRKPSDKWAAAREEISKLPGYKDIPDADLQEAFYQMEKVSSEVLAPFAPELQEVFKSFEESQGAGKATGVAAGLIKDAFLGGQGEAEDAMKEKSTRRTAFDVYDKLKPEEQGPFLQALGVMAAKLPKEERSAFLTNIAKEGGRGLETLLQQGVDSFNIAVTGAQTPSMGQAVILDTDETLKKRSEESIKMRRQVDFMSKVQNIAEGTYDPTKKVFTSYLGKLGETIAYGTPQVLATSVMASNPYTGAALFMSLTESHYQSILAATEAHMGYEKASKYASAASPFAAAIETASEGLQSSLLRGKLPMFDKALTGAMDKITNPVARGLIRFGAGGLESGLQEVGQNYIDAAIQGVSNAFGADTGAVVMPSAQDNVEAFASVFPLALMGIPGAAGRDQRVKRFATATSLQYRAAGYSEKSESNIREGIAKGLNSGAAAIDGEERDPTTPEAITAQKEHQAQLQSDKAAGQAAQLSGVMPSFVKTPDGWSVRDGETGEEFGTATTIDDALRLANDRSAAVDSSNENQTAFLYSLLQAGEQTTSRDNANRQTGFEASPGQKKTTTQESAISPADEARVMAQLKAREAMGGDSGMSDVVLGKSVTEFKNRVRKTVNKINSGGTALTVFHEETHGFFREALETGRLTKEGTIETIRAVQAGFKDKAHHFLPESGEVSDTQLDEAVSEFREALVLKNRKKDHENPGVVAKNLAAFAAINANGKKEGAFVASLKDFFGQVFGRVHEIKRGVKEGKIKESDIEAFTNKLFGLTEQDAHDAATVEASHELLGEYLMEEGDPFSLGPAKMADVLQQDAMKRITDPKVKGRIFQSMSDRLAKVQALIANTGNAYNFDAFGKPYEPAARFSQEKKDTLNALAIMDGILAAMPPDLRGRVGGYTQLAKLETQEKRLDYLKTKIKAVEKVVNGYLSKEYTKQLDKLFERAKPAKGKPGEKPTGKVGADVHSLFDVLRNVRGMDQAAVDNHISGLEAGINSGNLTPEQVAHDTLEASLVGLVGNWSDKYETRTDPVTGKTGSYKISDGADVTRRAAAVAEATRVFEKGYATFKLESLLKAEDRKLRRKALEKDTGKTGDAGERDAKMLSDNGLKGGWKDNFLSLISFEQLSEYLFGRDSKEAIRIVDMERKASDMKEDSTQADMDKLDELFTNLGGGSQIRWELAQKNTKVGTRTLSQLEMVKVTMLWAQEDGRRHMLGTKDGNGNYAGKWHYDQAFVDQVESKLSDEAKAVRAHLQQEYGTEHDWLNPVFVELNGVNLPKNPNYSPLTVTPQQSAQGQMASPVTGAMGGTSSTPGSLRTRGTSIAEPDFTDALQTFIAHRKEMRHWVAYAPFNVEVGSIIRNRELGNSIEEKGGKQALSVMRGWMDYFTSGGVRDAASHLALNKTMNRISGRAASSVLIGRMGVLAIQTTQLGAALAEMPTGSFAVRFGKLLTGQLGWSSALKSEYIQRRVTQMPVVVQQAMEGLKASKPNQLKHQVQNIGKLIGGVDGLMTAGTYAICYDYQLKQAQGMGLSGAEAESYAANAAERSVDRVAQPTRPGTRSLFENTTSTPAMRVLWAFASESRQKLALSMWRLGADDRSLGEKVRAVALTWVVGGMMATIIRAAMRDMKTDDDDEEVFDEKNWGVKRLALSSLTGPFQGLPFLGDVLEAGVYSVAGEYLPEGNMLSSVPKALKAATQVGEWGEKKPDDVMRDIESILSGAALGNDSISAASSLSHLVRDVYGIAENIAK